LALSVVFFRLSRGRANLILGRKTMPPITGRNTSDDDESVAASLKSMGDSMFKPVDPVAREKIRQMQMQSAARTNIDLDRQRATMIRRDEIEAEMREKSHKKSHTTTTALSNALKDK
jgi:hypothetical protein